MTPPFERTTIRRTTTRKRTTFQRGKAILLASLLVGLVTACWLITPEQAPVRNLQNLKTAGLLGDLPVVATSQQSSSDTPAKQRYEKVLAECRDLAKECREISIKFFDSSLSKSYEWKEKWPAATKALSDHRPILEEAALDWFFECEQPSDELMQLVSAISRQTYLRGDMDLTWEILSRVKKFYTDPNDIKLNQRLAQVGLRSNRFEYAAEFLKMPGAKEAIESLETNLDKNLFAIASRMLRKWKAEVEIRKKEAEADDLPRVKFVLSSGEEAIIELFENEAPQTVANFISLVESGFYDDSFFHPVIAGVVAQTGMYNRSHSSQVDYVIKNESREPNARKHFTGCLTLASEKGGKDSGSTTFAVTLVPNPELDWNGDTDDEISQPVFGRVISGLKHIAAMPVTVEIDEETQEEKMIKDMDPGSIKTATVIRKRDHEYTFDKKRRKGKGKGGEANK